MENSTIEGRPTPGNAVRPDSGHLNYEEISKDLFVVGPPISFRNRLQHHLNLALPTMENAVRRAILAVAIGWLPLALLA